MKKTRMIILPLLALLFSACTSGNNEPVNPDPGPGPIDPEPPIPVAIKAPTVVVNGEKNGLIWNVVENAASYSIQINEEEITTVTTPGYTFSLIEGRYEVYISAIPEDTVKYKKSPVVNFNYEVKYTSLGELSYSNGYISWANFTGLSLTAREGVEGTEEEVSGNKYQVFEDGNYYLKSIGGYDEVNHVYYVDNDSSINERNIEVEFVTRTPLDTPVLTASGDKLTWEKDENAIGYEITLDDGEPSVFTENEVTLNGEIGSHTYKVRAIADEDKYNSELATFSYEAIATSLGEISLNENIISWTDFVGLNVEVKLDGKEYVAALGNQYEVTKSGLYFVHAANGFDNEDNVYYVENDASTCERSVYVKVAPLDKLVVEDGSEKNNSALQELYTVQKYDTGWKDTISSTLTLDDSTNMGYTEGNCIRFQYYKHSSWFKYEKQIEIASSYDTLTFTVKGNNSEQTEQISLFFQVIGDTMIGDINLAGVYLAYNVNPVPGKWTKYSVSLNDSKWRLNYGGQEVNFDMVKPELNKNGYAFDTIADILPFFNSFQVRCYTEHDDNWTAQYLWMDDIALLNTGNPTSSEALPEPVIPFELGSTYAFKSDTMEGKIEIDGDSAKIYVGGQVINASVSLDELMQAHIVSTASGNDFDLVLASEDSGNTFTLVSVSGSLAGQFNNLVIEQYTIIDDFESYEETGVGYDSSHDKDSRTGLRAAYYSEYYSGGTKFPSPLGGTGWELMQSSDYLSLDKTNGRNDSQAIKLKYNRDCDMKYTTYGLFDGSETVSAAGKTFSFWAKGTEKRDTILNFRIYNIKKIDASSKDMESNFVRAQITVPQNSDWAEYKITLAADTIYYGFSVNPLKKYDIPSGTADYFLIDDISIYNNLSPWGN